MRRIIGGLALLLVLAGTPAWAAADNPAPRCKAQMITELDLTKTPDGNYLVPLSIGGEPVWMVLNTGGNLTALPQPAIDRFHLRTVVIRTGIDVYFHGDRISSSTTLSSLTAGAHHYTPVVAGVIPGTERSQLPELDGKPIVGYFGTEALARTDFELHLAEKKLRLFSPDHCRGVGAYWTNDYASTTFDKDPYGAIFFAMALDGKLIETSFSTGNPSTSVDANITRKAFGFDATSPDVEVTDRGRASYRAMSLTMPGFSASDVRIALHGGPDDCGYRERIDSGSKAIAYGRCGAAFPLSLGRDVLERMRLYVALKERRIYFSEVGPGQ